jgi:protease-4
MLRHVRFPLLLALAALPPASATRADEKAAEPKKETSASVAHIRLAGTMEDVPANPDPLFGTLTENFKAKLDRIKKAKNDASVRGLYLQIDGAAVGWSQLDELSKAIADFKTGGKKVFAYMEQGDLKDYLLALSADEVCLPESGWLMLNGLQAEVMFYKELFDKIGIQADILHMGEAKTAAEPFTRTKLSDASRKQLQGVLDDHFDHDMVDRIVASRQAKKLSASDVRTLIDRGPYTARAAHMAGLVDKVEYSDAFQEDFKSALKVDKVVVTRNYGQERRDELDFSSPFAILKLLAPPKPFSSSRPKVAVIYASGEIVMGKSSSGFMGGTSCGSTTMIEAIRQAENDKTVKAIVLRVDSPGGSALASDLIWNELARSKKPVIASMSDVAASGGYYICMSAQKIYVEPGTLTGSIGVVGGKLALGGLYGKLGLTTDVLSRGANAGIFSTSRGFNSSEREAMTALMQDVYDQFLDKALQGRKKAGKEMTREALVKIAGGRVWTGRQALDNGLVDAKGSLDDAVKEAAKLGKLPAGKEPELLILPKPKSFLDTFLEKGADASEERFSLAILPLMREFPELKRALRGAGGMLQLRGEPVWLTLPYRIEIK